MKMTREYFGANVDMAIELEHEDGYRFWKECKGSDLDAVYKKYTERGYYFSDEDYCCRQSDEKVRNFLNLVCYNADHNPKYNGLGWHKVLDIALDNWDY